MVVARVRQQPPTEVAVSVISVEEQISGWYQRLRQAKQPEQLARAYERLAHTIHALSRLPIVLFTMAAIDRYRALQKANS